MSRTARWATTIVAVLGLILGTAVPATAAATPVGAAVNGPAKMSLAGFNPGNIISDAVFTDRSTMTEAQIQTFFNSKVKTCRAGYTCLKDYRTTSVTRPADNYCRGYAGAANESAARIIYRVAQACDINPQVLIVMLQKEQGLINHTWPSQWRYDAALGQACPDTAPCDPKFVGFFHQIYGAARQMQIYMEGRYFQWYKAGQTWQIQWHPDRARCGTGPVYIANKATEALYYYTPYQPNAAAMRAGYGTGDSCSSYGNRNFYNYFTDWFGSTQKPPAPAVLPKITDINKSEYVLAARNDGTLLAYPFSKGSWGRALKLADGLGADAEAHLVGDFDGRGYRDVLLVDSRRKALLLAGKAGGGFTAARTLAVDWSTTVLRTPAGDFDGDGVPDMFTTDSNGDLWLWPGDDRGDFGAARKVGIGWGSILSIAGGQDFTGDGNPDLIAKDTAGALMLFPGNGQGGWGAKVQIGQGWQGMDAVFSPGDFSGDGKADVLARKSDGSLWHYRRAAADQLADGVRVGTGWSSMVTLSGAGEAAGKPRLAPAGTGDVDGDGAADVTGLTKDGRVLLYRGDGKGRWRGKSLFATDWQAGDRLLPLGDFTGGDGRDFGRIDRLGRFLLATSGADGRLSRQKQIGSGFGSISLLVSGIDFDGDRIPDVLGRTRAGELVLYRGNGRGGWNGSRVVGTGWNSMTALMYPGDFDGDGQPDIIARHKNGDLILYRTNGAGRWLGSTRIGTGWNGMTELFASGDFDGDGRADVLARTSNGDLKLYPGNGRGGWLTPVRVGTGWNGFTTLR